jgi:DNA-binding MarR family transcriptional regulator
MDVNSSISLLSHIHTITADFITEKLKERGFPDFASSHGNILFQLSVNEKMTMSELAEKIKMADSIKVSNMSGCVTIGKNQN